MRVRVLFFGQLKEIAGAAEEDAELSDGARVEDLFERYSRRFPKLAEFRSSMVASVNQEYATWSAPLSDGDEVAFLPPVSGGEHVAVLGDLFRLVREPIRSAEIVDSLKAPEDGAVVAFDGFVRNSFKGRKTLYLEYEAYEPMALAKMQEIGGQIRSQFQIHRLAIVHRLGRLDVGESSVLIVVSSPHRAAAFDACRFAIDALKSSVPIWKKEFFADGAVWAEGAVPTGKPIPGSGESISQMKKSRTTLCGLCAMTIVTGAWLSLPLGAGPQKRAGTIRVTTDLVNILASVIDANERPVLDLSASDFTLTEEGVPQKIERFEAETNRPLDLVLMIDSSASTFKDAKFENEAAAHFIRQVVRPGDTLAVFEFSEKVTQLSEFSDNVPNLQAAVRRIVPGAGTSIYDAVVLGSQAFMGRPAGRRRAIVMVTDAGETTSVSKFEDARRAAIASEELLYTIVIRPMKSESGRNTAGEHALITMTDSTGGAMFILDELSQIDTMYDRIDRELRTQYLLGYYPNPTPPPGTYRHVEVTVKSGDMVRHRSVYLTSGTSD